MADRCLKPKEYAQERRLSLKTLYRLMREGKVPAERIGGQWRIWLRTKANSTQNRTS